MRKKMTKLTERTYQRFLAPRWMDLGNTLATLIILMPGFASPFLDEERKPSYLRAAVGEAVVFNCHIEFPHDVPIPYILNWNKEGETIFSSYESMLSAKGNYKGRIRALSSDSRFGKGSINITNIRETDGGWYECQVTYPNRSPTRHQNGTWFHLKVDGGNVIAIPPINQTTMEGELARFPCSTKEDSSTVVWKKDGVRLSNRNHNFPVRYTLDSEGTLTISPTEMDDLGEFTCEATNSRGEKQSASAFLNVQYKAKVIHSPKEIYLPFGRSAVMDCHFRSNPPLMKLRWEKDGFLFDPYNVQGVVYRSNGSLFFEKVKEEHEGLYTCTPFNELGTEGPSPKMKVVVQKPPVFTVVPHMLYIRKKGDTVQIPCDATEDHGVHKPNIAWFKNGRPVSEEKFKPSGGNLTLAKVQEEDRGIYQCIASNAVTSIFTETELMIENTAPRAPYDVKADSTEHSVKVTWKSGLTKPKLEFSVWYRVVDGMVWKFLPSTHPGDKEVTIPNLLSGTEYEVMVLSQDLYGDGMFSKSIRIKTKGEPNHVALGNHLRENFKGDCNEPEFRTVIRCVCAGRFNLLGPLVNGSLIITEGLNPSNRFGNDVDEGFRRGIIVTDSDGPQVSIKRPNKQPKEIYVTYRGQSPSTMAKSTMEPPRNLNIYLTSEGLMITWDPPEKGVENLNYYGIEWRKNEEVLSAFTRETFFLVKDYIKGETYKFQVFAVAKDDNKSEGSSIVMHVPSDQKAKAVTLGVSLGFVLLIITILLTWFFHKHFTHKT